jgi:hypothetical protein
MLTLRPPHRVPADISGRQALEHQWRAQNVAAEPLAAVAIAGSDADGGVQAEGLSDALGLGGIVAHGAPREGRDAALVMTVASGPSLSEVCALCSAFDYQARFISIWIRQDRWTTISYSSSEITGHE